jgi:hypothetical protein
MLNNLLQRILLKIHVAKYISRLDNIEELYNAREYDDLLTEMDLVYGDLLRFPQFINISSTHQDLMLKTRLSLDRRNVHEVHLASDEIKGFLNNLYGSLNRSQKANIHLKKYAFIGALVLVILLAAGFYYPLKEKYAEEKRQAYILSHEEEFKEQTLKDLQALKQALDHYYNDNKSYPNTGGSWDGILSAFGKSKTDWIPGLAPKYIKELPIDPRKGKASLEQYMYQSDGKDFKLIAHYGVGITDVINNHPEMVDPIRPSWAFGIWSEGGKSW